MDYLLGVDLLDDYADADSDSQENNLYRYGDDSNLKRRKINIAISLNCLLNLEGSNYFRYPIVRKPKGNFHRDRDAIMRWVTILDDIM